MLKKEIHFAFVLHLYLRRETKVYVSVENVCFEAVDFCDFE